MKNIIRLYQVEMSKWCHKYSLYVLFGVSLVTILISSLFYIYIICPEEGITAEMRFQMLEEVNELGELSLSNNIDYFQTDFSDEHVGISPEKRKKIEDILKIEQYKKTHDWYGGKGNSKLEMGEFVEYATVISVTIIMFLGIFWSIESILAEEKDGSIKLMLISPNRRREIFFAKVIAVLTILTVFAFAHYIFALLIAYEVHGEQPFLPYVGVMNGEIYTIPFVIYHFLTMLVQFVPIVLVALVSLLFGIITRNNIISSVTAVGVYFLGKGLGGESFFQRGSEFLRFVPFYYFGNVGDYFEYYNLSEYELVSFGLDCELKTQAGPCFSIAYFIILVIILLITGTYCFERKEF